MMKKFLLFFSLMFPLVLSQNLRAEELALVVLHADGNQSTFLLSEKPEECSTILEIQPNDTIKAVAVDLGLSVKWASCNVGANSPEEYGGYYAWGETSEKSSYTEENNLTLNKAMDDIAGTQYDVAHVKWGGSWRMPTEAEFNELIDKCTWTQTTVNDVNGMKITGPNGNSIFLPAAGWYESSLDNVGIFGGYWSSTPYENLLYCAYGLYFGSSACCYYYMRFRGWSIRPVTE